MFYYYKFGGFFFVHVCCVCIVLVLRQVRKRIRDVVSIRKSTEQNACVSAPREPVRTQAQRTRPSLLDVTCFIGLVRANANVNDTNFSSLFLRAAFCWLFFSQHFFRLRYWKQNGQNESPCYRRRRRRRGQNSSPPPPYLSTDGLVVSTLISGLAS